jgi:enoyl-CoA hydratase
VEYKNLLYEKKGNIGIVTISNSNGLNLLNIEVFSELFELFSEIENDPEARLVILTGSGGKAFVAGVDVAGMKDKTSMEIDTFLKIARKAGDKIYDLNKPVIAAVNGVALGGGCELALQCDLRIASENARFGQPEINLGIVPGGGGIQRLARLIGMARAKELVYTGRTIDARTALNIGLVNKVVPADRLIPESIELAAEILSKSSVMLAFAKKAFHSGADVSLSSGLNVDEDYFARCFATEDQKEGMKAFMEKRKPEFKNR